MESLTTATDVADVKARARDVEKSQLHCHELLQQRTSELQEMQRKQGRVETNLNTLLNQLIKRKPVSLRIDLEHQPMDPLIRLSMNSPLEVKGLLLGPWYRTSCESSHGEGSERLSSYEAPPAPHIEFAGTGPC